MAESCRKWCLVFIGFAIKLVYCQCLRMRECSFLGREAEPVWLSVKVWEMGWLSFPRQKCESCEALAMSTVGNFSERCLSLWKVTLISDIPRTSEAAWTGDIAIALVDVVGFLFKFPGSYHLRACQPDFQLPAPSFLYIRLFSSCDGSLVQLCGRSEVPGN